MQITYKAHGLVLGKYWGGGGGSYDAKPLQNDNLEELLKEAQAKLEDNSLDAGMGFESLRGALLNITTIRTIIYNGLEYENKSDDLQFVGTLTEREQDFLLENI